MVVAMAVLYHSREMSVSYFDSHDGCRCRCI